MTTRIEFTIGQIPELLASDVASSPTSPPRPVVDGLLRAIQASQSWKALGIQSVKVEHAEFDPEADLPVDLRIVAIDAQDRSYRLRGQYFPADQRVVLPQITPEMALPADGQRPQQIDSVASAYDVVPNTIAAIRGECEKQGIGMPEQVAYVLATVYWETARTFKPVEEGLGMDDKWRRKNLKRYYPYYGRGYVQLTWKANYQKYGELLGLDLVNNRDLALDHDVAMFILVHGFRTGAFTGKKITNFIDEEGYDFYSARKCINGLDKAQEIANIADEFLEEELARPEVA